MFDPKATSGQPDKRTFDLLLESSSDILISLNTEREIVYLNPSATRFFGACDLPSELSRCIEVLAEDGRSPLPLPFDRIDPATSSYRPSRPLVVKSTSGRTTSAELTLIQFTSGYLVQLKPLSVTHEIERQIILQARLLDHVDQSIIACDDDSNVIYWNKASEIQYGWTAEEALGKSVYDLIIPPESREAARASFFKWRGQGLREGESYEIRKDGTPILTYVRVTPVYDRLGNWIGHVGLSRDLTAENAREQERKQSLSLLEATLQSTTDGILVVDLEGKIAAWNQQFLDLWNIPVTIAETRDDDAAIAFVLDQLDNPEAFVSKVRELYSQPKAESFDTLHFKDGRVFERASKPQLIDGVYAGRVWSFRDVTSRTTAQKELESQKSLYESLIHAQSDMGEGFVIASPERLYFSNEAAEQITGYSKEELTKFTSILSFVPDEERAELSLRLEKRLRGERVPDHYETKIVHKTGRIIDIELAIKLQNIGSPRLIILFRDISKRKEIERSLVQSESKFRTVVDNLGEGIVITDRDDRILYMNSKLSELSGYSATEGVGKISYELMMPDSERTRALDRLRSRVEGTSSTYELELRRKDGESRWCLVNAVPYYDSEGKIVGTVGALTDIHEQKQREIELKRTEERFRYMTLATSDIVYDWVFATNEIWWSEALSSLMGYDTSKAKIDLETWSQLVHPDDIDRVVQGLDRALSSKRQQWRDEYRFRRSDGSFASVIDRGYVVFDADGNPSRMIGAMMDVTDRKRAEEEIRKAAANTSAIIENTNDAILSVDQDLKLITYNSSFVRLFESHNGMSPYVGLSLADYLKVNESEYWQETFDRAFRGEHFTIERNRSTRALSERTYEMSFNPIIEDDKVVGVSIFDTDITARKEAEEALKRSKANLRALIENTNDAIWSIDAESRLITFNSSFRMMFYAVFGIDPQEGLDLRPLIAREGQEFWQDHYPRTLAGEQHTGEYSETLLGETHHFEVSFNPIISEGKVQGATIFTRNVSERKKMENQLIAAKERAEEMNRLKSSFLANMSHEIRTPMTAILGFASIIREFSTSQELDSYANTIERSGTRLLSTINSILDLAKIEANKIELRSELIDPKLEIEKLVEFYRPLAANKGIQLLQECWGDHKVMVDEQYLSQVLTNLLGNALKFTHSGSIRIESGKSDESQAFIRVSDTGIGISREFLPEIFEEFKQESGGYGRSYEGSGLGLTITKKLVELMNGTIKIESEQGIGTSITLTFPIGKEERLLVGPEGILKSDQSDSRPASTNGRLPRVLLVEDTQETSQMVKIFTRGKCELDIAHNAETALELASQHSYDLVLMDVNLGNGRSGLDVACDLRKDVRYGSTPIIALTAYAMKGDKESAIAAGCTDYLSKPFNKADLLAKLKQFIPA